MTRRRGQGWKIHVLREERERLCAALEILFACHHGEVCGCRDRAYLITRNLLLRCVHAERPRVACELCRGVVYKTGTTEALREPKDEET